MRILLIDQFGEIGGAQRVLLEAAEAFARRGWALHAAVPAGPLEDALRPFAGGVTQLTCGPFHALRKSAADVVRFGTQVRRQAAAIGRAAREARADVLYVNGPRVVPAAVWARGSRPVVFHAHSVVLQRMAAELAGRALAMSGARVLASSRFAAGWLERYLPRERVRVIYNGAGALGGPPAPRSRFTRIGVLGRVAPEKGQLVFVRAARIAARRNPGLTFVVGGAPVIAGADYFAAVEREAGPEVRFAGWVEDLGAFFSGIDLLVVPSAAYDANPRVIPEAFAAGVPVLAFDGGGVPELIEHGVSGLLVRRHDALALARAMLDAVDAPEWLNAIAQRAYARWQSRFTLERFQEEVSEALEAAVLGRRAVRSMRARASV